MIVRTPRDNPVVLIERAVATDERLSYRARGLLLFLVAHEGEPIEVDGASTETHDENEGAIRELIALGYLDGEQ